MHENDEISVLNTNKIDFLSDKSPSKRKIFKIVFRNGLFFSR